jgi:hypothetical protein
MGRRPAQSGLVALIGAAVIHFALAPVRFDEAVGHGVLFTVVAWAQFGAAFALLRWRSRPAPGWRPRFPVSRSSPCGLWSGRWAFLAGMPSP